MQTTASKWRSVVANIFDRHLSYSVSLFPHWLRCMLYGGNERNPEQRTIAWIEQQYLFHKKLMGWFCRIVMHYKSQDPMAPRLLRVRWWWWWRWWRWRWWWWRWWWWRWRWRWRWWWWWGRGGGGRWQLYQDNINRANLLSGTSVGRQQAVIVLHFDLMMFLFASVILRVWK